MCCLRNKQEIIKEVRNSPKLEPKFSTYRKKIMFILLRELLWIKENETIYKI